MGIGDWRRKREIRGDAGVVRLPQLRYGTCSSTAAFGPSSESRREAAKHTHRSFAEMRPDDEVAPIVLKKSLKKIHE